MTVPVAVAADFLPLTHRLVLTQRCRLEPDLKAIPQLQLLLQQNTCTKSRQYRRRNPIFALPLSRRSGFASACPCLSSSRYLATTTYTVWGAAWASTSCWKELELAHRCRPRVWHREATLCAVTTTARRTQHHHGYTDVGLACAAAAASRSVALV
jgi:hypothetical protein